MSKKGYRVPKEIKEQIINRIKNDGVSVLEAAKEYLYDFARTYFIKN